MLFSNKQTLISNGLISEIKQKRNHLLTILSSIIQAVDPYQSVLRYIKENPMNDKGKTIDFNDFNNIYLVGFGKASVGMAQAICDSLSIESGAIITNEKNASVTHESITTFHGGHPLPNKESIKGATLIKDIASNCKSDDLLLVLISGGGSALLCHPKIELSELQLTTQFLLKSGASIHEINTIRKHLSNVKGGKLIENTTCPVLALIISDVVGDPIEFIASGPTAPDSTTYQEAKDIFKKYNLWAKIPSSTQMTIMSGISKQIPETLKKDNPVFSNVQNTIIANNHLACKTAYVTAQKLGYRPNLLTTSLTGEARHKGSWILKRAEEPSNKHDNLFITGGETTVTIHGSGTGGRNQEMALAMINELNDKKKVFSSFATDGIDGTSNAAGAIVDGFSLKRANKLNLDVESFLQDNNSFEFFRKLDDLLITGPTGTNVMDVQILIT